MDTAANQVPTVIGTPFEGGFYAGRFTMHGLIFALIVAPKVEGSHGTAVWNKSLKAVKDAESYFDGAANTKAMAEAGSNLAKWAFELNISGHTDWYLPSRDELELCYRNLKPGSGENSASFRDGENPSSVPVGYPYTDELPAQTTAEPFRDGGPEAFDRDWHWSSTSSAQNAACAWGQGFGYGYQGNDRKNGSFRARAVRRVQL